MKKARKLLSAKLRNLSRNPAPMGLYFKNLHHETPSHTTSKSFLLFLAFLCVWYSPGIRLVFPGLPLVFPWSSPGHPLVFPGRPNGLPLVLHWFFSWYSPQLY